VPSAHPDASTVSGGNGGTSQTGGQHPGRNDGSCKEEGQLISYGMSDDWVNLGNIWKAIEDKVGVVHTDTDMTSAEQITRLLAEKMPR